MLGVFGAARRVDCVRCVWCCQEGVIVLGVFGAARRVDCVRCVWCCQEDRLC